MTTHGWEIAVYRLAPGSWEHDGSEPVELAWPFVPRIGELIAIDDRVAKVKAILYLNDGRRVMVNVHDVVDAEAGS